MDEVDITVRAGWLILARQAAQAQQVNRGDGGGTRQGQGRGARGGGGGGGGAREEAHSQPKRNSGIPPPKLGSRVLVDSNQGSASDQGSARCHTSSARKHDDGSILFAYSSAVTMMRVQGTAPCAGDWDQSKRVQETGIRARGRSFDCSAGEEGGGDAGSGMWYDGRGSGDESCSQWREQYFGEKEDYACKVADFASLFAPLYSAGKEPELESLMPGCA